MKRARLVCPCAGLAEISGPTSSMMTTCDCHHLQYEIVAGPASSGKVVGGVALAANSSSASRLRYRTLWFLNANSVPMPDAMEVRPDPIGPPITTCRGFGGGAPSSINFNNASALAWLIVGAASANRNRYGIDAFCQMIFCRSQRGASRTAATTTAAVINSAGPTLT